MAIAAVPTYLGQDFSTASPGLRFGMYLKPWGNDFRIGAGGDKASALKQSCKLTDHDKQVMHALRKRQAALADPFLNAENLLAVEAKAIAPFTTGLGNEHPLENGFAFLNPYGLPYLPGSGVKGVLRQAARELASGDWGEKHGWTPEAMDALFGKAPREGSDEGHQRGALTCWDVIPQLAGDTLQVEVMTPHQTHYYQQDKTPHDSGSPNPITFLTVPPGSSFTFHIQCDEPFLQRLLPELVREHRWQALLNAALTHAFDWLGFGAKTAVGYGAMQIDAERARRVEQDRNERQRQQAEQRLMEKREAAKATMSPADKAIADLFDQRVDKNQDERAVLFSALKASKLGEHRVAAAERLRDLMKQQGRWREKSEKKNPDKDQPYQDTLMVKKWLAP
jgi:CRISPR-associated protein Cmr6